MRPLTVKARKYLIAHDCAAGGVCEAIVDRLGPDLYPQAGNAQRLISVTSDRDMIDMRTLSDHQFEGGVDLIVDTGRTVERFNERHTGARLHDNDRARIHCCRRPIGKNMRNFDRLFDIDALCHAERHTTGHKGRIE